MNDIKIPIGRSSFADIRNNGYYYIDKSGLIRELLKTEGTQVTLITRPRRFGKTLGMSMLAEFFDIQKDSREMFKGLAVSENRELCRDWMNQYPTLFLTLKSVDGSNFNDAAEQLKNVISEMCIHNYSLLQSSKVNELHKECFLRLAKKTSSMTEIKNSIQTLIKMLSDHYDKPIVLLLDEYDVPLAKASEKGYYPQMLDIIKGMMQSMKDNPLLKFAVITGCLRIAKESIFTGANNFVSDTIADTRLNEYFGFTQTEVNRILAETGLSSHSAQIREWYDGYHFGDIDVYCPWDVMNHVNKLLFNPDAEPADYWGNTSNNAIIRSFIDLTGNAVTNKFETLLSGGHVVEKIEDDLTYDYLHSSEENLWSILYLTGYLTDLGNEALNRELPKDCLALKIPNAEVRRIFEKTFHKWFAEKSKEWNRQKLFAAVWSRDAQTVTSEMIKLLRRTISFYDYKEDFYHAFFAGIFAGAGYEVESNKEHGEGRSDIVVKDYAGGHAAIFEVKYSKSIKALDSDCEQAVSQIDDRAYTAAFEEDYANVICYGISFFKKRCLVKVKKQEDDDR